MEHKNGTRKIFEPFNEVYINDCFMNTLLCAAKNYGLDNTDLCISQYFIFEQSEHFLRIRKASILPIQDACASIGLMIHPVVDDLESWKMNYFDIISSNKSIIALVDDYYNPLRADTYLNKHLEHFFLIYDIDDYRQKLCIIESQYRVAVIYKNMELSYLEFEQAHFSTDKPISFICNSIDKPAEKSISKGAYLLAYKKALTSSIKNISDFRKSLQNGKLFLYDSWLEALDEICNLVKVELYIFKNIFKQEEVSLIAENIYKTWYLLRAMIIKLQMINKTEGILLKTNEYLEQIVDYESKKLQLISEG